MWSEGVGLHKSFFPWLQFSSYIQPHLYASNQDIAYGVLKFRATYEEWF